MKAKLQARLKSKKGFTLVELLVVVAIIAILVAISIPMVSNSLNKAREATDDANVRAARGAAMVEYLTDDLTSFGSNEAVVYYYDAQEGKVYAKGSVSGGHEFVGYNQNALGDDAAAGQSKVEAQKGVVAVTINVDGGTTAIWVTTDAAKTATATT